jgi:NADH-quinone oxidoreductase subunit M
VIAAAAYLLWALKRVLYGPLQREENRGLTDLTGRELAVLVPLLALIVWLGLYPNPVLRRLEGASRQYIEVVHARQGRPDTMAAGRN